jgi:hypothetical protein
MKSPLRRTTAALITLLVTGFALVATASSASAEDGYRYWNYSHLAGDAFEFAQTGPGDAMPKDGDVEGWRYGTSTVSQGISPRADLDSVTFDAVCGAAEAAAGEKRVAVLIDYGTESDADGATTPEPRAECAVVPNDANGQQVLDAVVDLRADQGMICALDGYPAKGCGEPVGDAEVSAEQETVDFALPAAAETDADTEPAAAEAESEDGGAPWTLIAVALVVAALAAVAVPLYRRNRDA